MKYQIVFHLIFLFFFQLSLLSIKSLLHQSYEINWIEWKEEWANQLHDLNRWNDNFLLFLPFLLYYIVRDLLTLYRPYFPMAVLDETAFHAALVFLLHPIQLHQFYSPLVRIEFIFIIISYITFKKSASFKKFNILAFILFAALAVIVGFFACRQFLWDDIPAYSFGVLSLLLLTVQTIHAEFHPVFLFWAISLTAGTLSLGAMSLSQVSVDKIINVILKNIDLSNRKLLSILIPTQKLNTPISEMNIAPSWIKFLKLFEKNTWEVALASLSSHSINVAGGENSEADAPSLVIEGKDEIPTIPENHLALFFEDIWQNFQLYISVFIFFTLIFYGVKVIVRRTKRKSETASKKCSGYCNILFGFYSMYVLFNIPSTLHSKEGGKLWDSFNYFDVSTIFVLLGLAFTLADGSMSAILPKRQESTDNTVVLTMDFQTEDSTKERKYSSEQMQLSGEGSQKSEKENHLKLHHLPLKRKLLDPFSIWMIGSLLIYLLNCNPQ